MKRPLLEKLAVRAILACLPVSAQAVDIIPGQGVPPPPDMNALMVSYGYSQTGEKYTNGQKAGSDTRVDTDILVLRYTRSFSLAEKPAVIYVQPSFARSTPGGALSGADSASGLRDTAAAFAIWPYSDREAGRYFGVAAYFVLPTGEYDSNRLINQGQNRYSGALQTGYQTRLTNNLDGLFAADVQWFGANDDYPLLHQKYQQQALYTLQVALMHHLDPATMLAATYYLHQGGEGQVNGVTINNALERTRYQLTASRTTSIGRFVVQYGEDLTIDNGFKENRQVWLRHQIIWK